MVEDDVEVVFQREVQKHRNQNHKFHLLLCQTDNSTAVKKIREKKTLICLFEFMEVLKKAQNEGWKSSDVSLSSLKRIQNNFALEFDIKKKKKIKSIHHFSVGKESFHREYSSHFKLTKLNGEESRVVKLHSAGDNQVSLKSWTKHLNFTVISKNNNNE